MTQMREPVVDAAQNFAENTAPNSKIAKDLNNI